jgi:hypothetical protein
LNILFRKTFDQMGLSRSMPRPSQAPFHGIVPGAAATLVGQISLPVTFETRENFRTENIQFEVVDFETAYNAFLGWPALSKFMAILHYSYLVLKMPGPCGVIFVRGDVKQAFYCDRESCEAADRLLASVELQELKQALAKSPQTQSCLRPRLPRRPSNQRTHSARQSHCPQRNIPRWLMWATVWIPNRNSRLSNSSRKIGTSSHGSLLTCQDSLGN